MMVVHVAISSGRVRSLIHRIREDLEPGLTLHTLTSDVDTNRTEAVFAGESSVALLAMERLIRLGFDRVSLPRHVGTHPRIGAVDGCWVITDEPDRPELEVWNRLSTEFEVPLILDDVDAVDELHELGFGGILGRPELSVHPKWGVLPAARRPFYLTVHVECDDLRGYSVQRIARAVNGMSIEDPRFAGVYALGFMLPSRERSRLVLEFRKPDEAPPDPVLDWVNQRARDEQIRVHAREAIGVVRRVDLLETRSVPIRPNQIIDL